MNKDIEGVKTHLPVRTGRNSRIDPHIVVACHLAHQLPTRHHRVPAESLRHLHLGLPQSATHGSG